MFTLQELTTLVIVFIVAWAWGHVSGEKAGRAALAKEMKKEAWRLAID